MTKQNQALFTKLTPEQAAAIEGGATLRLDTLRLNRAGSDDIGGDDPIIRLNGNTVASFRDIIISNNPADNIFSIDQSFAVGDTFDIQILDDDDGFSAPDPIETRTYSGTGTFSSIFSNEFSSYTLSGEILP
ncbi:hypothetical protein [Pleurocapsa sp. PCC 7319]|uniref:hypothetical protein n=1 Tax=Pleurocapsa sp. PCC 7319 TaxID=118161 RepID=UPI00034924C8|nr:hypothetical protein [Pleurocapsa sp. PCC 7319]